MLTKEELAEARKIVKDLQGDGFYSHAIIIAKLIDEAEQKALRQIRRQRDRGEGKRPQRS